MNQWGVNATATQTSQKLEDKIENSHARSIRIEAIKLALEAAGGHGIRGDKLVADADAIYHYIRLGLSKPDGE